MHLKIRKWNKPNSISKSISKTKNKAEKSNSILNERNKLSMKCIDSNGNEIKRIQLQINKIQVKSPLVHGARTMH